MTSPHWSYPLYRLAWSGLDWLFPPECGGCGKPGTRWCSSCQQAIVQITEPFCRKCGTPLAATGSCTRCSNESPPYRYLRSWLVFDFPIRQALHKLKYRRDVGLGDALAAQLAGYVASLGWPLDAIVPVPLGGKRLRERGYNQTALIARPLALALGLDYRPVALRRTRETSSQVGLSALERRENVRGAFWADAKLVRGKTILVLDDVATTGSTLSSCAEALFSAGAKDVFALTVARALARHGLNQV